MPSPPERGYRQRPSLGPPLHSRQKRLPIRGHLRRFTDLRYKSVLRGTLLVFISSAIAFRLAHFPEVRTNPWLILPLLAAAAGTADTVRCMQKRWTWYHGGVVLCVYTDLMALCMILFFLLYPLSL